MEQEAGGDLMEREVREGMEEALVVEREGGSQGGQRGGAGGEGEQRRREERKMYLSTSVPKEW